MGLAARCDRCYCELSGLDTAYLLRYDDVGAWLLTNQNRTALQLLDGGENIILCEECMNGLQNYLGSGEPEE